MDESQPEDSRLCHAFSIRSSVVDPFFPFPDPGPLLDRHLARDSGRLAKSGGYPEGRSALVPVS